MLFGRLKGAQVTEPDSVRPRFPNTSASSSASRVFPTPPEPEPLTERAMSSLPADRRHGLLAAHEAARRDGKGRPGRGQPMLQDPTLELDQSWPGLKAVLGQLSSLDIDMPRVLRRRPML